jgi:phospholipase/carboxylesterase
MFREAMLGGLKVRIIGGDDRQGAAVVLMHGFGAPGTDLLPFASEIEAPAGTRFVFPEAPLQLPAELGAGRAWWHIDMMQLQLALMTGQVRELRRSIPEGLAEASAKVTAMLGALVADFGVERLVLGGFSQGAMLACDVALRSSEPLAGLVMMSGSYLAEDEWAPLMPKRKDLPVLMSHGRDDPLLPFSLAEALRDALVAAGLDVSWVPFDGGHGVAPRVVGELSAFVQRALL